MADMPRRAQTGLRRDDRVHQLLGVQIALHQQGDFAGAGKSDRLRRSGAAVWRINQAEGMSAPAALATAWMRAAGPIRTGTISPAAAASRAASNEAASTGCT